MRQLVDFTPEALRTLDQAAVWRDRVIDLSDPDALHQLRIALRTLGQVLRVLQHGPEGGHDRALRRRLREFMKTTNAARDLEVHQALTQKALAHIEPGPATLAWRNALAAALESEQTAIRQRLIGEQPLAPLLLAVRRRLVDRPPTPEDWAKWLRREHRRARRRFKRARRRARRHPRDSVALHRLRLAAKRLRYLVEVFGDGLRAKARARHSRYRAIQSGLGRLRDLDLLWARLAECDQPNEDFVRLCREIGKMRAKALKHAPRI